VLYHHVAGLSYREVAAATGGSADAARRAAADGMARLREIFARDTEREGGRDDGK
jgi:DNA-directed RNA polymerase specialized sigma24 family protein